MTDDNQLYELSRRKVLAGLGTVGAASAAAGLGTSALFSDTESFEDNTLTAGSLDLKVDWEEHYSYPQVYGFDDPASGLDVTRTEPEDTSSYTTLPAPENPMLWVHEEDLDAYMDNTAIEAFPDPDDDGVQESFDMGDVGSFCDDGADTPSDLDPVESFRTNNDDTMENEERTPLVNLNDVKPGDFGELTLSFHLCDNDGYVWIQGDLVGVSENGITEPESDAAGEDAPDDDTVELLDEVQTALWYDGDCDNVFEAGGGQSTGGESADVVIVLDRSGSMSGSAITEATNGANTLIDALGPDDQVSVVSFADGVTLDQGLTMNHNAAQTAVNNISTGGGTNMEAGVQQAHEELYQDDEFGSAYGESGNARPNARKIVVFLSDGVANEDSGVGDSNDSPTEEATDLKNEGAEVFTIAYGSGAATQTLDDVATDPPDGPEDQYAFIADESEIEATFQEIGGTVGTGGEEAFFRGTLREALSELTDGEGIPLDGDLETEERACYPALQTSCVGFAWWVPTEVGNEIQSDSVQFDIGFYAEQCRNNDGSGPATNATGP
jgi:Ca-activated chloride channel family protein